MTPDLLMDCLYHARKAMPLESCGLLLWDGVSKATYRPCRNTSAEPDRFAIHPEDMAQAEDGGTILGIVHSHPDNDLTPSPWDLDSCMASGLPWWIVAPDGRWARIQGRLPLEGRPYAWGVQDCLTIIQDWQRERGITVPDPLRVPGYWEQGLDPYRDGLPTSGFARVTDEPRRGDVLFFGTPVRHAGIYLGHGKFIHHREGDLSRSETLDGYWQRTLSAVVRSKC